MIAALLAALTTAAAPSSSPAPSSPRAIFRSGLRRLAAHPVAPYAVFTATWHTRTVDAFDGSGATEKTQHFVMRYAWRKSDGIENASHDAPHSRLPYAGIREQFLGPLAWSLEQPPAHTSTRAQPDIAGMRTIATVVAVAKPIYTLTLVGVETVDGHTTYHIALHPTVDPVHHNLRDLWFDVRSFDLWKARYVSFYGESPTTATITFRIVQGYHVLWKARWSFDRFGKESDYAVEDGEIVFLQCLPDWLFDKAAYDRERKAGTTDLVGQILREHAQP